MAKNKTKSKKVKLTKEDVRRPDAFISTTDRVVEKIQQYKVPIFGALGLALGLGIAMVAANLIQKQQIKKANQAFVPITREIKEIKEKLIKERSKASEEASKGDDPSNDSKGKKSNKNVAKKDPKKDSKDAQAGGETSTAKKSPPFSKEEFDENFSSVIEHYESLIATYLGTSVAAHESLSLASLYIEYNMWEKANKLLLKVVSEMKTKDFFYGLVHTKIGTTWMEMGQYDKAIESYDKVLASKKHGYLHGAVFVKKGLSYEQLNQMDKARELYERVVKDYGDTESGKMAQSYLRYMDFRKTL